MKKQSNKAVIWVMGLLIAIPLFIALAGLNFIVAALDHMTMGKSVKLV